VLSLFYIFVIKKSDKYLSDFFLTYDGEIVNNFTDVKLEIVMPEGYVEKVRDDWRLWVQV